MSTILRGGIVVVATSTALLLLGCGHAPRHVARIKPPVRADGTVWDYEPRPIVDHPSATLTLHIADAAGCTTVDPDTFTCSSVDVTGDSDVDQAIYLFATGVDSLVSVRFGIEYTSSVTLMGWVDCVPGGGTIAPGKWPTSGSSIGRALVPCKGSSGPGDFVLLGYFLVRAGSAGSFRVTRAVGVRGDADISTCGSEAWTIGEPCGFGCVHVGGRGGRMPFNPCGQCD